MRLIISFLVGIMLLLIGNIIVYSMSEDYRFFIKKLKYSDGVVYDNELKVDDTADFIVEETGDVEVLEEPVPDTTVITGAEGMKFLDILSGKKEIIKTKELPELSSNERDFVSLFEKKFVLSEENAHVSLFNITTEYPDEYYEFSNKHISVYVFPTKSYQEVKKIFQVLEYELPYSINEVNNFGRASFYINLDDTYQDGVVRIVLEHKNRAFGLKIKKDSYNSVKEILESISPE